MGPALTALKPLTPWQIVALAALVHSLVSGMWIGFPLFAISGNTTPEPPHNERTNP